MIYLTFNYYCFFVSVLPANYLNGTEIICDGHRKVKDRHLEETFSFKCEAKEIGGSEHVQHYLTLVAKYGVKLKTTGNQKLSPRTICNVIHEATQNGMSSNQIKVKLDNSY